MKGPGKGKTNNPNGRKKGVPNKTTQQAKDMLEKILFGQLSNVNAAFSALKKDPAKYIDAYSKMLGYVLPKKTDLTSGDEKLSALLPDIIIKTKNDRND